MIGVCRERVCRGRVESLRPVTYWTFCEHGFEGPKSILTLRCPFEHLVFLSKICQWLADIIESLNEMPVEVGKAKERLYVYRFCGTGQFFTDSTFAVLIDIPSGDMW